MSDIPIHHDVNLDLHGRIGDQIEAAGEHFAAGRTSLAARLLRQAADALDPGRIMSNTPSITGFGSLIHRLRSAAKHPHMDNTCRVSVFDVADATDQIEALYEALSELDAVLDFGEPGSEDKPWLMDDWTALNAAFAKARAALALASEQGQ